MTFMKYSIRGLFESFSFRAHETYVLDSAEAKRPPLTIYLLRHVISVVEALADCGRGFSKTSAVSLITDRLASLRYLQWVSYILGSYYLRSTILQHSLYETNVGMVKSKLPHHDPFFLTYYTTTTTANILLRDTYNFGFPLNCLQRCPNHFIALS